MCYSEKGGNIDYCDLIHHDNTAILSNTTLNSLKPGLAYWFVQEETTYHTMPGKNLAVFFFLHYHHNLWDVDDKESDDEHLRYRLSNSTINMSRFTHTFSYLSVFDTLQPRNSRKTNHDKWTMIIYYTALTTFSWFKWKH